MKIYKIFRLSLLLFAASVVSCQKDNDDFSLSTSQIESEIASIYDNMVGISESKNYSIGRYEVTQAQWQAVTGYNPSRVKGDDRPVDSVTEEDVCYFLSKLEEVSGLPYRLPTTSEWYTAAGATPEDLEIYAWYSANSNGTPHEVGKKSPNTLGLYDMFGNVAEYVADGVRTSTTLDDPKARGGSWNATAEECATSEDVDTQNWNSNTTYRIPTLGLRLLIDLYIEPEQSYSDLNPSYGDNGEILIVSAQQLTYIGTFPYFPIDGDYLVSEDITASGNWTPIGTSSNPFTGTFDGGEHTISGLAIDASSNYQGLFGYASKANIKNVKISNLNISSSADYVGGVVGYAYQSVVENCEVIGGSVSGNEYVGGVVGYLFPSSISDGCYVKYSSNSSSVNGVSYVGGVVGESYSSTYYTSCISDCSNDGSISGESYIGGIVGHCSSNWYRHTYVLSSYNTGSVDGDTYVGGVVGRLTSNNYDSSSYSYIRTSYNTGTISGSTSVGGVVGYVQGYSYIKSCYNVGSVSGTTNLGILAGYYTYSTSNTYSYYIDQSDDDATVAFGAGWATTSDPSVTATFVNSAQLLNDAVTTMNAGSGYFTAGSPSTTNLPHLMGENLLYTGTGAVEPDSDTIVGDAPDMEYETLF